MLVLTRRENERIVLPTLHTAIQVVRIAGSTVRLGIEAPPEVPVLREELLDEFAATTKPGEPTAPLPCDQKGSPTGQDAMSPDQLARETGKVLDCLLVALEVVDSHLAQGDVAGAREILRKALAQLHQARASQELVASRETSKRESQPDSSQRVALVVQNVKKSRRVIAPILERAGYKVRIVANGCQALEYLAREVRPELIVLDFDEVAEKRGDCDAVHALREIRKNPGLQGVKIIALGRRSPAELQVSIGPHGVDQWVQTTVQAETYLRELNS